MNKHFICDVYKTEGNAYLQFSVTSREKWKLEVGTEEISGVYKACMRTGERDLQLK